MFVKLFKILIALSMFLISVGSWRYQGDIHHMHKSVFKSEKVYSQKEYRDLWKKYSQSSEQKIEMKVIHLYDFLQNREPHTSELIMDKIINSKEWRGFIPNSNSSTYKMSQKVWISQNLTVYELMGYFLAKRYKNAT